MGRSKAQAVKKAANNSFARNLSNRTLILQMKYLLEQLNLLLKQIAELDKEVQAYFTDIQRLLQSIPGIGKVWSATILAEVISVFHPERRDGGDAFVHKRLIKQ